MPGHAFDSLCGILQREYRENKLLLFPACRSIDLLHCHVFPKPLQCSLIFLFPERGCIIELPYLSDLVRASSTSTHCEKKILNTHFPERASVPLEIIKVTELKVIALHFHPNLCHNFYFELF